MKPTPKTSAFPIQRRICPQCGEAYAVCVIGLIMPHLFGTDERGEMGECLSCFTRRAAQFDVSLHSLAGTRASNFEIHLRYSAAAG